MKRKRLAIGTEDFEKLRSENLYYVDKTGLIKELLNNFNDVTLFTRPRRFGKSLNMSMLRYFFEIGSDSHIFDGLAIAKETSLCEQYMAKYPVISISLKNVEGFDFESAKESLRSVISAEARRFSYLEKSICLGIQEKRIYEDLQLDVTCLEDSLRRLSELLYRHHNQKVIILIDEYDVPLDKAYLRGYYEKMVQLLRQLFSTALKTNEAMQFAVLTGCLRISKESIFTGLNNLSVNTIVDTKYDEWFGFTEKDVHALLNYYGLHEHYAVTREWYDGYRFGKTDMYCPWDVINWCDCLLHESDAMPQNFWANTSSNDMIVRFAENASATTRKQIEALIEGNRICKKLKLDLTYPEIDSDPENLWSVLFTTGYLTQRGRNDSLEYELIIPNREIQSIFKEKIDQWFSDKVKHDANGILELAEAFLDGDTEAIEEILNDCLSSSISYNEAGNTILRESFYHGLLLGMLQTYENWNVLSNREAGNGRADIIMEPRQKRKGYYAIIIEVKYARTELQLDEKAMEALRQIDQNRYDDYFKRRIPDSLIHYGISFSKKECRVLKNVKI